MTSGQAALWSQGISGDWPIVLATIKNETGLPSVRQLLVAHRYWRAKGVRSDLVILNMKTHSYAQELQDQLVSMSIGSSEGGVLERPGGVFIRRADALTKQDEALLRTTARIFIRCDGIGLGAIVAANIREHAVRVGEEEATHHPAGAVPLPLAPAAAAPAPAPANGYGQRTDAADYAIDVAGSRVPPAPWANVIANPNIGFCVTERGGGFTWVENSYFYRLTPWFNDPVSDPCGEVIYLRDDASGVVWSPTPGPWDAVGDPAAAPAYRVTHSPGASRFAHVRGSVETELTLAVPASDAVKIAHLRITNRGSASMRISLTSYVEWTLGADREDTRHQLHTSHDAATGALFARNYYASDFAERTAFSWISEPATSHTARRDHFLGRNGDLTAPAALRERQLSGEVGAGYDPCAAFRCALTIAPGETKVVVLLLGAATSEDDARALIARHGAPAKAIAAIDDATRQWNERLSVIAVHTPDPELDALFNRWSLYQALACRMWARSALYQSSGAFGFRDQLQDTMAFVYAEPAIARAHLLRSAGRQFAEGDVQHWWHEPSGRGVRTRFSDDLAWLPFVADHYVRVTADTGVWDARAPYLSMRQLEPHEQEVYDLPQVSDETGTLYEHCVRALDRACTEGAHGLPLMGAGDWNDGMNRVGMHGSGESVWLAWFLTATLRRFAAHADARHDAAVAARYRERADRYAAAVERTSWDGAWYRRAYFDDGTPLGTSTDAECRIDAIAQSWSVISGAGEPARARQAMESVNEQLVRDDARLLLLLTPPFDATTRDPGYIKGYLPGVRENGAQYTHAALWTVLAMAKLGDGDRTAELFSMLNPFSRTRDRAGAETYMVEPYVVPADVYAAEGHLGRGGWTWYTGSASWSYRVALEGIFGFEKRGEVLRFDPCIPRTWPSAELTYRCGKATYVVELRNPEGVSRGVVSVTVDGVLAEDGVRLVDDGATHAVVVTLGSGTEVASG